MVSERNSLYTLWLALSDSLTWQARQRLLEEPGAAQVFACDDLSALVPDKAARELHSLRSIGLDKAVLVWNSWAYPGLSGRKQLSAKTFTYH